MYRGGFDRGSQLGAYVIDREIGRGGMAIVYGGFRDGRRVAIKVLPEVLSDGDFRARFEREATSVLEHPNILAVLDHGTDAGANYIVTELVSGGTLESRLGRPMPLEEALAILRPIASALDHAHRHGILHRDVKPGNILMRDDGTPLLSDFGLAKLLDSRERLTRSSVILGTPEYLAPEQCTGEALGPAADIYSLAVTAYEMLTGRVPFSAETPLALVMAHVNKTVPIPRRLNPTLSAHVSDMLLAALAKDPAARPATAGEFVNSLATERRARRSATWIEWSGSIAAALAISCSALLVPTPPAAASSGAGSAEPAAAAAAQAWASINHAGSVATVGGSAKHTYSVGFDSPTSTASAVTANATPPGTTITTGSGSGSTPTPPPGSSVVPPIGVNAPNLPPLPVIGKVIATIQSLEAQALTAGGSATTTPSFALSAVVAATPLHAARPHRQ